MILFSLGFRDLSFKRKNAPIGQQGDDLGCLCLTTEWVY